MMLNQAWETGWPDRFTTRPETHLGPDTIDTITKVKTPSAATMYGMVIRFMKSLVGAKPTSR